MNSQNLFKEQLQDIPVPHFSLEAIRRRGQQLAMRRTIMLTALSLLSAAALSFGIVSATETWRASDGSNGISPIAPSEGTSLDVFLHDDISTENRERIRKTAREAEGVDGVRFITKRAAYREFKDSYRERPEYWENLPKDALPARFIIQLEAAAYADPVTKRLRRLKGVDEIRRANR